MKRAFVIHIRAQDTSALDRKVSEVVPVIEGSFYPFDPGEIYGKIVAALSQAVTEQDFIVPMGSTLANFLAGYYLGSQGVQRLKLMIHDVKTNTYREVVFLPEKKQ